MRSLRLAPIFLALSLAGCGLFASHTNGPLVADAWSPIKDVPVPVGFSQAGDSRADVANNQRIVDQTYTGSDQILPVTAFYKDQLPKYGWTLTDTDQVSGKEVVLHFSKDKPKPETCVVTVTSRSWTFDTAIRIRLAPAAPVPTATATTKP